MKKILMVLSLLVVLIFLVGCLNYKAGHKTDTSDVDKELAALEEQAKEEQDKSPEPEVSEVSEKVTPPEPDQDVAGDLQVIKVKENEMVNLNVDVKDPDNDQVTYSFTKPLSPEGKWKTDYGDAGEYVITLTATDGKLSTDKKIKLIVERVNVPPVIALLNNMVVDEGKVVTFEPKVTDPNNDPVTVTVSDPLKSGSWSTDHQSAGDYKITVTASDGELQSQSSFTLKVNDINVLPVIANIADLDVKEGDLVVFRPLVTDEDEDSVTTTISDPVGNDGEWQTDYTDHGTYAVTIVVDDGKSKVTKKVNLLVEDVNMPPEIVKVSLI